MDRIQKLSPFPGGYGRSALYVGPEPPRAVRGSGIYIWDEDGHRLVDLSNNFTALVHGHRHPRVLAAARAALDDGTCFGLHNIHEFDHASTLIGRIAAAEQVRYTNSGTEAAMIAIRLARAFTAREHILLVSRAWHGMTDATLPIAGPAHRRGIPAGVLRDTLQVSLNDVAGLSAAFDAHGNSIAAVLLDLIPNHAGLVPATAEFVDAARRLTSEHGALLVLDEVISLRLAYGGYQSKFGVQPDLTLLAKLIGGGFPVGALVGRAQVMSLLDPGCRIGVIHGGTFSGNPISMRAGLAALQLLTADAIDRINKLGAFLRSALEAELPELGWTVCGDGSLVRIRPACEDAQTDPRAFWWAAYERGVLITPAGLASISTPMTHADVERAGELLVAAARDAAKGRSGLPAGSSGVV